MSPLSLCALAAALASLVGGEDSCVLLGRLVDGRGRPLADAQVRATSCGDWRAGAPAAEVEDRQGRRTRGLLGATDADGRFELTVPVPSAEWVTLELTPDEHHMLVHVELGLGSGALPLSAGVRDVGEIVARDAGVVFGRIVDVHGDGIARVRVRPRPGATGSAYYPAVLSIDDGSFRLAHLPVGSFALTCRVQGYLARDDFNVTVERGADHGPVEIELARAVRLTGRVVDAQGAPVSGVRIAGLAGDPYAPLCSDAEGRFDVPLEKPDAQRLEIDAHGYERQYVDLVLGASELEIVLHPVRRWRIEARDAWTGAPVERFGARATEPEWPEDGALAHRDHVGGVALIPVRRDQGAWQVDAPGYAPAEGIVEGLVEGPGDPGAESVIEVALVPGGRLTGTLVALGAPVRAVVYLALDDTSETPDPCPDFPGWWWTMTDRADLSRFVGRMRRVASDEHGRFEFVDLAAGTYRLLCEDAAGRFVDLRQLEVPASATLDLGQLCLTRGARIHGTLTADGQPVAWVDVILEAPYGACAATTTTDEAGRYSFEGVHPACYHLVFRTPEIDLRRACRVNGTETLRVNGRL